MPVFKIIDLGSSLTIKGGRPQAVYELTVVVEATVAGGPAPGLSTSSLRIPMVVGNEVTREQVEAEGFEQAATMAQLIADNLKGRLTEGRPSGDYP